MLSPTDLHLPYEESIFLLLFIIFLLFFLSFHRYPRYFILPPLFFLCCWLLVVGCWLLVVVVDVLFMFDSAILQPKLTKYRYAKLYRRVSATTTLTDTWNTSSCMSSPVI